MFVCGFACLPPCPPVCLTGWLSWRSVYVCLACLSVCLSCYLSDFSILLSSSVWFTCINFTARPSIDKAQSRPIRATTQHISTRAVLRASQSVSQSQPETHLICFMLRMCSSSLTTACSTLLSTFSSLGLTLCGRFRRFAHRARSCALMRDMAIDMEAGDETGRKRK